MRVSSVLVIAALATCVVAFFGTVHVHATEFEAFHGHGSRSTGAARATEAIEEREGPRYLDVIPSDAEMQLALSSVDPGPPAGHGVDGIVSKGFDDYILELQTLGKNTTLCKECVEKSVKKICERTFKYIEEICEKEAKKPKPDPHVAEFCKFAKAHPKAAVIASLIKQHAYPILRSIRICHFYGLCQADPPPVPQKTEKTEADDKADADEEVNVDYGVLFVGALKVTEMMELPEKRIRVRGKGDCTMCEREAVHQIEQGYEKAAFAVCKYAHSIPNDEIKQYCELVAKQPKKAFAILLKALNLSIEKIKEAAMQACEQQGLCAARRRIDDAEEIIKLSATR